MANLQGRQYPLISLHGEKPVRIYGGIRNDIEWVAEGVGLPESEDHTGNDSDERQFASIIESPIGVALGVPVLGYFAVIDPVLSFLGDTITLPYVIKLKGESARER